jgi:protein-disulfide isomerase
MSILGNSEKKGILDGATPNLSFLFGLVLGLAVVSFIGFIFLLTKKGNDSDAVAAAINNPTLIQDAGPIAEPAEGQVGTFRPVDAKDHVRGAANAAVTIIEYSDTECPFCKQFHTTMKEVLSQNEGKVKWVYRNFPLRGLHQKAAKEAEALECANELGGNDKFWEYADRLYAITPSNDGLDAAELPKIASAVGLNQAKFETCLSSGKFASKVSEDERDAVSAGGRGTPYSIILGPKGEKTPLSGALPSFEIQRIIDSMLAS